MNANPNTVQLKENATLLVRAGADVFIRGWDQPELEILCDGERFFSEEGDGKLARVVAKSDLYLSVPVSLPVRIEHIGGDALISGMTNRLEIQKVGGDLAIEKCAQVDLSSTGGDVLARKISGLFNIQRVGGDLQGAELSGGLSVEAVGGDASFQASGGALRLRVGGDLVLGLPPSGSDEVVLKAGGDITMFVVSNLGARLDLSSGGQEIEFEIDGKRSHIEAGTYVTTLGDGALLVRARAGGDISISDGEWDEDDLDDEFESQIEQWEKWKTHQSGRQMDWNNLENRIRSRAEAGARRAEERVREAMERVERQNRRREGMFGNFGFNWGNFNPNPPSPQSPIPPVPPVVPQPVQDLRPQNVSDANPPAYSEPEAVSTDERTLVLKMLQEHKISLEEAEQLLKSLEGDFE